MLLSSHQLREVEATVDRLVVIAQGRLVSEGTLEQLTAGSGTRVAALDAEALRAALDRHGIAYERRAEGDLEVSLAPEDVGRLALREQLVLTSLGATSGGGLEDVFFSLTGQSETPTGPAEPSPPAGPPTAEPASAPIR